MAVDLLFRGVLPRSTRIFNLNENLLNRLSQAEVIHATDFRVIPFSYTLAKFTTLKCSSLINTALFNTILKALDYEQPLFFLSPSSKTHETRKWPRARASRSFAPPARLHCSHYIWRKRETARSLRKHLSTYLLIRCQKSSFADRNAVCM